MEKFLRCYAYGLTEGETLDATVEGQAVQFTYDNPKIDVPIAVVEPVKPE